MTQVSEEKGIAVKVLICSDTHRVNDNFYRVLQENEPIDLVIHCGDAEGTECEMEAVAGCDFEIVSGNNDFFTVLPRERVLDLYGNKILVTHGHYYRVSAGYERLAEEAASRGCNMAFFGHTHLPFMGEVNGVLLLNPGSLTYPRQYGRVPTYVIMTVDESGEVSFQQCVLADEEQ